MHWVDKKYVLQDRVLAAVPMNGPHTGANMADIVRRVVDDFELVDRVFCLTTDNASSNYAMARIIEKEQFLGPDWSTVSHMPCLAHVLNLVVQAGTKQLKICTAEQEEPFQFVMPDLSPAEVQEILNEPLLTPVVLPSRPNDLYSTILDKLHALSVAIRASPGRRDKYRAACMRLKLPDCNMITCDVPTRWNSALEMIEIALAKKPALNYVK